MSEQNIPASSPANAGQGSGAPQGDQPNSPAVNQAPGAQEVTFPDGTKMPLKDFNELKRKAGRFEAEHGPNRSSRREQRDAIRSKDDIVDKGGENDDPGVIARDQEIRRLSTENEQLQLKNNITDIFQRDEYKDVPKYIKNMISRRPYGFVNETSKSINDKVMDIEDFLDDYLDEMAASGSLPTANKTVEIQKTVDEKNIPPANGSGPASPNTAAEIDVRGKTGSARSTAILQNLFKNRK